jgi:hypothetical protein
MACWIVRASEGGKKSGTRQERNQERVDLRSWDEIRCTMCNKKEILLGIEKSLL